MAHAEKAPSGSSMWLNCHASIPMNAGKPDQSSEFAAEGSVAHEVSYLCGLEGRSPHSFVGEVLESDGYKIPVTAEMADFIEDWLGYVEIETAGCVLLLEQKLPIGELTIEPGAHGTADVIAIDDTVLKIMDLKYGMGVKVFAEENTQLLIYALAALDQYRFYGEFETIELHIGQPRLNHFDRWVTTRERLEQFRGELLRAAMQIEAAKTSLQDHHFNPSEKTCKWCRAKADCLALANHVLTTVCDDFVDITKPITVTEREMDNRSLANCMTAIPLIEDWCKAIRGRVEAELFAGEVVPGYKIVEGKRGNREWTDDEQLIERLEAAFGEDAFKHTLISPAVAEKLAKKSGLDWAKTFVPFITQSEGKPSVAPESDKRPAILMGAELFDNCN